VVDRDPKPSSQLPDVDVLSTSVLLVRMVEHLDSVSAERLQKRLRPRDAIAFAVDAKTQAG
jgi:hypothetical protein